ncbi:MAG: hypothetical protein JNK38_08275 [Acidobacteria bacterium]|nr:hypothetical protein [Acidobacteriota bacterium]
MQLTTFRNSLSMLQPMGNLILVTGLFFCLSLPTLAQQPATAQPKTTAQSTAQLPESISATEFSKLSREMSEDGGYFLSDNFSSNETSYLHIVNKLKQIGATGGAYIGVGPEQNFTYIAKIRPRIAFLIDIRRQAIIQHLMYKAIFHHSPTRTEFLSRLLCKPLPSDKSAENDKPAAPKLTIPKADASIEDLLVFFGKIAATDTAYTANLAEIVKTIEIEFQFPLSKDDRASLEYVYKNFRADGLEIAFRMDGGGGWGNYFPSLRELILQPDLNGKLGNFLAVVDDYNFVRDLHRKNLIIPVVGDFGGSKALNSIGDYLRKHDLTVSAYYLSNVEQYLFDGSSFEAFAKNVKRLPLTDKSLFIRAVFNMRYSHPAAVPGHISTTLLQLMTGFVKNFDAGKYHDYGDVIFNEYISAQKP